MTTAHGQNDHRFDDAMKEVRALARTHAEGDRALAVLFAKAVHWSADRVIDSTRDKHGEGKDDAKVMYEGYLEGYSKKAADSHTANGKKANASKLRQLIKVGEMTTIDPKVELSRMIDVRRDLASVDPKQVRQETHMLIDWARTQMANSDGPLSDNQLRACALKPAKSDPKVIDILERVGKTLEKLISGEAGVKDQHEKTIAAFECVRERLAALLKDAEDEAFRAKAIELGYDVSKTEQPEAPEQQLAA